MSETVFGKIIKGELPSHKVYEDDKTLAFLDIAPVQPGMTVVVPKVEVPNFEELPDDYYQALWQTVRKVAKRMRQVFPDKAKIAVAVEGFDVAHAHVKLFPINTPEELHAKPPTGEPDHQALATLAERLKF